MSNNCRYCGSGQSYVPCECDGAKLAALEAELQRLRKALRKIVAMDNHRSNEHEIARLALDGAGDKK